MNTYRHRHSTARQPNCHFDRPASHSHTIDGGGQSDHRHPAMSVEEATSRFGAPAMHIKVVPDGPWPFPYCDFDKEPWPCTANSDD